MVRKGKWKAIRNGSRNPVELYDLSADPSEALNLAGQHPDIAAQMATLMDQAFSPSPNYPIADRKLYSP